ncbi:MAG: VWA domain-containing protein [Gammaproteobacteria bacterium]|nr:VWA domain-containing protein [Gammaproteobacteria bacterium]
MIRSAFNYSALLLFLLMAGPEPAAALDDIRIVIDVSGSMLKTDPNNLRAPALKMLNGLIPRDSKAGVWMFGEQVSMEVKWDTVNDSWRKQADQGAARIHSRGQFTNIESALRVASSGWQKPVPGARRNLVLLTDGKIDIPGNQAKNEASRSNVLAQLIPDLIKKGVKVHSIALSDQTDEVLLRRLALKTGGSFEIAHSADDLQRIFLRMFERAIQPDTVPLQGNKFTIDDSINEMTLLVFRKSAMETKVVQPGGVIHTESSHAKNVKWRFEKGYDLITIVKPEAGVWSLLTEEDSDNRVMIVTDLKLVVNDQPAYTTPDKSLDIQLELHDRNEKIDKNSFLKFVDFKLEHHSPNVSSTEVIGALKSREISDKGLFRHQLEGPLEEGEHELIISADARTFSRSKRYTIEVQWPISVAIEKTEKAGIYQLIIQPREEYIKPESLSLTVKLKKPDGSQHALEAESSGNLYSLPVVANEADGLHQILISFEAETVDGNNIQHELGAYNVIGVKQALVQPSQEVTNEVSKATTSAESKEALDKPAIITEVTEVKDSDDTFNMIFIVALVNLVIITIVVAVFFYLRKKKQRNEILLLEEE